MPARPAATRRLETIERTRERILSAARDVVAEGGWQAAQIAVIAARAKVATGSVYRYFESKAALYTCVLDMVSDGEVAILREIADAGGPAPERLARMITAFAKRAMKSRRLAYALIAEPCEPEIDAERLKYRAVISDQFARVVHEGIESGEFVDADEKMATSCVVGAFVEALVVHIAPDSKAEPRASDRMAASIARLCVRMVMKER